MSTHPPCPPADRIRLGDVWSDIQCRLHRAEVCEMQGLMLIVPIDHKLKPVAIDQARPYPWKRITWGGQ